MKFICENCKKEFSLRELKSSFNRILCPDCLLKEDELYKRLNKPSFFQYTDPSINKEELGSGGKKRRQNLADIKEFDLAINNDSNLIIVLREKVISFIMNLYSRNRLILYCAAIGLFIIILLLFYIIKK